MNRLNLNTMLIVDLEATCWENEREQGNQQKEIIEIGIVEFNLRNFNIVKKSSYLIKPENSEISKFCTELTTITPEMIERDGIALKDALKALERDFQPQNKTWSSWGDYDRNKLHTECREKNVNNPFSWKHLNLKNDFARMMGLPKEVGVGSALRMLNMQFEGTHHRGVDDAINISRIFAHLFAKLRK